MIFSPTTLASQVAICWDPRVNRNFPDIFSRNIDSSRIQAQAWNPVTHNLISSTRFNLTHPMSATFSFIHHWFQKYMRSLHTLFSSKRHLLKDFLQFFVLSLPKASYNVDASTGWHLVIGEVTWNLQWFQQMMPLNWIELATWLLFAKQSC